MLEKTATTEVTPEMKTAMIAAAVDCFAQCLYKGDSGFYPWFSAAGMAMRHSPYRPPASDIETFKAALTAIIEDQAKLGNDVTIGGKECLRALDQKSGISCHFPSEDKVFIDFEKGTTLRSHANAADEILYSPKLRVGNGEKKITERVGGRTGTGARAL